MYQLRTCFSIGGLVLLNACVAMSVPVRLTYQTVDELPMQEGGNNVALSTGETFDVSLILQNEGSKRPEKLLLHKVEGIYVIVAEGWKNVYLMTQNKSETADVDFVPLMQPAAPAIEVKMRPGVASRCTLLSYKNQQGAERKLYIGAEGKTSPADCPSKEISGS